ncbi:carbohydrate-binding protein [Pyxidicoccus xibeiensis]|uniref:carbohydrate-binding protein n=1 Tax=Pyxidicoccus xibeiensis TaxID=2906759 RepID=UPI0020A72A55|nr:carbohydrate-binding protein [Pyxidicoccus xibeiensis]MCP3140896.1 CBM21 domain-containing protein [Pyxidicoccus xibeiensis]
MKSLNPGRIALLTLTLLFAAAGTARAEDPNVRLAYAKLKKTCGSAACNQLVGVVEVRSLDYAKQVTLVYTTDGSQWSETAAGYFGAAPSGYESWSFTQDVPAGAEARFALRYTVAGQTFWDNNGGGDYRVGGASAPEFLLGSRAVKLDTAVLGPSRSGFFVTGYLVLKNLAYAKNVVTLSSSDNWATVQEFSAVYREAVPGSGGSQERWLFSIPVYPQGSPTVPTVRFAIRYTVDGVTYWDNNLGWQYSLSYPNGNTIP